MNQMYFRKKRYPLYCPLREKKPLPSLRDRKEGNGLSRLQE